MKHWVLAAAVGLVLSGQSQAQQVRAEIEALFGLLGQDEIIAVMREEGLGYGAQVAEAMFGQVGGPTWAQQIETIYNAQYMRTKALTDFATSLENVEISPMARFFAGDTGKRIVDLEIAARRAMLDEQVTETAKFAAQDAVVADDPHMLLVKEFVAANDLIEMNVVGGMNGNYAFYLGLLDGGALEGQATADILLSDVRNQEDEIRTSTTEWINGFLYLAYGPLEEGDIEDYIAFSKTDAGQALNTALFSAYDDLFRELNYAVGSAAAQRMNQSEL